MSTRTSLHRRGLSVLSCWAALGPWAPVAAQSAAAYPSQPVRIIVPFGAGGAADTLPRLLGAALAPMWGQQVLIENRTGAAGNIGMAAGAMAAADGHTLTSAPVGNLAINPHLYGNLKFDVFRDFTPITLVASVQNVIVVNPAVPARTLAEFIALAKSRPGALTYASGGVGTQAHMGGELLKSMAGIDMLHVAYKGVGDSLKDLVGGQVDLVVAQVPAVKGLIETGKLRALALASPRRNDVLPGVPTVDEAANLKGYEAVSW
jgi:tripartite-type tricarboxylate transporter receptor subunit TctC